MQDGKTASLVSQAFQLVFLVLVGFGGSLRFSSLASPEISTAVTSTPSTIALRRCAVVGLSVILEVVVFFERVEIVAAHFVLGGLGSALAHRGNLQ